MVILRIGENREEEGSAAARMGASGFDFSWSGGRLCLDFTETLEYRSNSKKRSELLNSYSDLVSWCSQKGVLSDTEAQQLLQEATSRPKDAATVLKRAIALREAIHRVFSAAASGSQPGPDDLAVLNSEYVGALAKCGIVPTEGGFRWDWTHDEDTLDRVLWPVVKSAVDLLTSGETALVRDCASDECDSLFLDTSRNRSRRCNRGRYR